MHCLRSSALAALLASFALSASPLSSASAQTVTDSVKMSLYIETFYNSYVAGDTPRAACGAAVTAIWPNVLQDILGSETRTYGYGDYSLVATEGMYVPFGYGETDAPEGFLAHSPQLGGASDGPAPCNLARHVATAAYRMNGGTGPLNARPFRVTDWYATYSVPDGEPIALFEWEAAGDRGITFDASFESKQSREIDVTEPSGKRPVERYQWDFGDDKAGSGAKPTHYYDEPGEYIVILTVTDDDGEEATREETVTVHGAQLTVDIVSATEEVAQGDTISVAARVTNTGFEAVTDFSAQRFFSHVSRVPDELAHPAGQIGNLDIDLVPLAQDEDEEVTADRLEPGESVEVTRKYVVTRAATFRIFSETSFEPADIFVDWTGIAPVSAVPTESDSVEIRQPCQAPDAGCASTKILRYDPNFSFTVDLERYVGPSSAEASATSSDVVVSVGDSIAVRIEVTNTGSLPLENIELGDGVEAYSGGTAVFDLGPEVATLDRLEPGESGTLVYLYEAGSPFENAQLYVASVDAEVINPVTDQRTDRSEDAPICETIGKTSAVAAGAFGSSSAADDPENVGCATFTITNAELIVNDFGDEANDAESQTDDVCDVDRTEAGLQCTLRAAIDIANARSATEDVKIGFDLPGAPPYVIDVGSPLVINYNGEGAGRVVVDAAAETVEVFVEGGGSGVGFDVLGEATIRGISVSGFEVGIRLYRGSIVEKSYIRQNTNGIEIELDNNKVEYNLISGNTQTGVLLFGESAFQNIIAQNYIGTNLDGDAADGNATGVYLNGAISNLVEGNLISGNSEWGLYLGSGARTNNIFTNYIGTSIDAESAIPNTDGVGIRAALSNVFSENLVSGNTVAELLVGVESGVTAILNRIEANSFGVNGGRTRPLGTGYVHLQYAEENTFGGESPGLGNLAQVIYVEGGANNYIGSNAIGTQRDYKTALNGAQTFGFHGIALGGGTTGNVVQSNAVGYRSGAGFFIEPGAHTNRIEYNWSFFNAGSGVTVQGPAGHANSIRANSIYSHDFLGIDLGNDGTPTFGGGSVPALPVINAFALAADRSHILINGNVPQGRADLSYVVDFYAIADGGCNASGYGEGDYWIGSLTTRGSGFFSTSLAFPSQNGFSNVAATTSSVSGTSEFGPCRAVSDDPPSESLVDVWPGDTDNDGGVDDADRTAIEDHLMVVGPARREASDIWQAQSAVPWAPEATTYADANGDGRVDQTDLLVVGLNFGKTRPTNSALRIAGRVAEGGVRGAESGVRARPSAAWRGADARPSPRLAGGGSAAVDVSDEVTGRINSEAASTPTTTFPEPSPSPTFVRSERPTSASPEPRVLGPAERAPVARAVRPRGAPAGIFAGIAGATPDSTKNASRINPSTINPATLNSPTLQPSNYPTLQPSNSPTSHASPPVVSSSADAGSPEVRVALNARSNNVPVVLKLDRDEPRLTGVAMAMRLSPGVTLVDMNVGSFDNGDLLSFEHVDNTSRTVRVAYALKGNTGVAQSADATVVELILDTSAAEGTPEITLAEMSLATEWGVSGQATFRVDTDISTSTEDEVEVLDFALEPNYPNPFSERTTLRFALPEPAHVLLTVYDILGREVERMAEGTYPTGMHDLVFDAAGRPAGLYVYRLQVGDREMTRRMMVVR